MTYKLPYHREDSSFRLVMLGFIIMFIGFMLIALSMVFTVFSGLKSTPSNTSIGVGGCILLFFVPICFGAGTHGLGMITLLLAIILTIIALVFFISTRMLFK